MTGSRLAWLPVFVLFAACSAFDAGEGQTPAPADGGTSSSSSGATSSSGTGSSSGLVDAGTWKGCGLESYDTTFDTLIPAGLTEEYDPAGNASVLFSHTSNGLRVSITARATSAQHSLVHPLEPSACLQIRERITLDQKPAAPGYKLVLVSFDASHNFYLVILAQVDALYLQAVEQDTRLGDSGYHQIGLAPITPMTPHDIVFEYRHGDALPTYTLSLDGAAVTLTPSLFQVENPTAVRVGAPYVDPGGAGSYVLHELTLR